MKNTKKRGNLIKRMIEFNKEFKKTWCFWKYF